MQRKSKSDGYTLLELCVTLVIISITAAILFPVVSNCRDGKAERYQCMSSLKQIGFAAMSYAQDYDATLPPAALADNVSFVSAPHTFRRFGQEPPPTMRRKPFKVHFWLGQVEVSVNTQQHFPGSGGFLTPYLKNHAVVWCPTAKNNNKPVYMASDLADGANIHEFTNASETVITMDGNDTSLNIGHALGDELSSLSPKWNKGHSQILTGGAAAWETTTRHGGGASYLLADGHVRWMKPKDVYFPPMNNNSPSTRDGSSDEISGPFPGGDMKFNGRNYLATFHLR